jgi:dTDP-4-dehydrorhamnose reductase
VKVAVTGASGLLGSALVKVFRSPHTVLPLTHADLEITDRDQVIETLARLRPEVIIHTVAIRDPDVAELNPAQAFLVNFHGTRYIVDGAREVGARVAYISTDSVFDGKKQSPYIESDPAIPGSVYGRTKLRAEGLVQTVTESWIFRVSILFGPEPAPEGKARENFISKGLRKIAAGEEYVVAADQLGTSTYTVDAALKMMEVIESRSYGLYHLSNSGACTRLELAQRAAELAGLDPGKVAGKSLAEMNRPGPRLKYAVMAMDALERRGFTLPRSWEEALAHYVSVDLGLQAGRKGKSPMQ